MMKAHVITHHGVPEEVFSFQEIPDPVLLPHDVLIRVVTTSVNPLDCRIRKQSLVPRQFPLVLGFDVYGEVLAKGSAVAQFRPGDRVIASPSAFRTGANAELVAVDARHCALANQIDACMGAALPLVGITAYEALFYRLKIRAGQTVLIHAGAGGVGHIAIQLAKWAGCTVLTTASQEASIRYCQELGADLIINHRTEDTGAAIKEWTGGKGISLILDTVGGDTFAQSLQYLAPDGHICTILPVSVSPETGASNLLKNITLSYAFMGASAHYGTDPDRQGRILEALIHLVYQKKLKPRIFQEFNWQSLPQAHQLMEEGHTVGKIIIRVSNIG